MQQMVAVLALMKIRLTHRLASAKPSCKYSCMSRDLVNEICAAQPGAERSDPWGDGHDCWKIGGKLFAVIGTSGDSVSVKTRSPEEAAMLIETGIAAKARYFHRSWIALPLDSAPDELGHRIRVSYMVIRSALTRKARADLPPA